MIITTEHLESRKHEVAQKVKEVGQQKAANFYKINRSTFRDFLYKHDLPTQKETVAEEERDELYESLLEVAELVR